MLCGFDSHRSQRLTRKPEIVSKICPAQTDANATREVKAPAGDVPCKYGSVFVVGLAKLLLEAVNCGFDSHRNRERDRLMGDFVTRAKRKEKSPAAVR